MTNNTAGGQAAPDPMTALTNRVTTLERKLREQASVRALGASSFDDGGLIVNPGGASIALRVDAYDGSLGGAAGPAGVVAFGTAAGRETTVSHIDASPGGAPPVLYVECAPDSSSNSATIALSTGAGLQLILPPGPSGQLYNLSFGGSGSGYGPGLNFTVADTQFSFLSSNRMQFGGLQWQAAGLSEWRAQDTSGSYVPVRASSFPTSSSRGAKQNVTDLPFDPLEVITAAEVFQWEYRDDVSADQARHISPMADDLPDALVRGEGDDRTVDTRDQLGVVWAAVQRLAADNAELRSRVAQLEAWGEKA